MLRNASHDGGLLVRLARTVQLVRMLAPRELRVRYRQSILTVTWAVISPVTILVVYGLVLTQSFDVRGACAPYLSSAWTGLVVWTFFSTAVGGAVTSMVQSADLISKVYFPREAVPLSMTAASLADLGVGMIILAGLALVQGARPGLASLYALLAILVIVVWAAVISIVVAVLAAFARDVIHAVHLMLRAGFFASPVMYEASFLPDQLQWSATGSPVAVSITALRDSVLCGRRPDPVLLGVHLMVGLTALLLAVLYTRSVEARMADVI